MSSRSPGAGSRAAQYFVEMTGEAVLAAGAPASPSAAGTPPKPPFSCSPTPTSPGGRACRGQYRPLLGRRARRSSQAAESNYRMTREALLDRVPLRPEQIHRIWRASWSRSWRPPATRPSCAHLPPRGRRNSALDLRSGHGEDGHTPRSFRTLKLFTKSPPRHANARPHKDTWRIHLTWPVIDHAKLGLLPDRGEDRRRH